MPAASCLAITFTRRAVAELQERLRVLLPAEIGACAVHSFHSLGLLILRAHGATLGLAPGFRIADEPERAAALAAALGVTESKATRLLKTVSVLKRTGAPGDAEGAAALAACRRLGKAQSWVDFDDLVGLAVEILQTNPAVAALWRDRFRYLCVDEFQDVDEPQCTGCSACWPRLRAISCVIGDPNQAIYGFRGADAACFDRFGQDFPGAPTVRLGRNYRSTGTIVTAAAQVIGAGAPTDITRPMQEPIALHAAPAERAEAAFVAATIERLLGGHDMLTSSSKQPRPHLGFADFAVLYRTDAQSAALREAFDQAGIPFKKSSPALIAGQASVRAVLQALERQQGADLPARIAAAAEQLRQDDAAPDMAALAEARRWLTALAGSGDEAVLREQVGLSTEADFWDPRADRVSLLTMHAAKGLEFPVVFVTGLEDGLVPFSWGESDAEEDGTAAEERRLFYVAMTRAKDRLFLSHAAQRSWRGQIRTQSPSPFLRDIAQELVVQHAPTVRKQRLESRQQRLF
ncbi:MAG: ATP-dependent helicase [Acetobacteraceae bacterium]